MDESSLLLELTERYCEAHRVYHDLRHVATMLVQGREFPLDPVQVWAVWFHDAVYDPTRTDNEEQSALLAEARLAGLPSSVTRLGAEDVAEVARIVRDTTEHLPTCLRSEAVLDLDLAPLAVGKDEFLHNREAIRSEYAHVSDADFARGTAAFAERMLARDRLYFTEWGCALEQHARSNLERLLEQTG